MLFPLLCGAKVGGQRLSALKGGFRWFARQVTWTCQNTQETDSQIRRRLSVVVTQGQTACAVAMVTRRLAGCLNLFLWSRTMQFPEHMLINKPVIISLHSGASQSSQSHPRNLTLSTNHFEHSPSTDDIGLCPTEWPPTLSPIILDS